MRSFVPIAFAGLAIAAPQVVTVSEYRSDCSTSPTASPVVPVEPSTDVPTIQRQAHGTLPNGALPSSITDLSATIWSLIAANELFEVSYFTSLYRNLVNQSPGYDNVADYDAAIEAIAAIRAQEQLHAIAANAVLTTAGRTAIEPCNYTFPVTSFDEAVTFASTFTDVVLGTLGEASNAFGTDGDSEFLTILASVIGTEAEQVGWYRSLVHKIPSALPFLSASSGAFAWSLLNQVVIVPGSCPQPNAIGIPILQKLTIVTSPVDSSTTSIDFSVEGDVSNLSVVYINQQNTPIVESLSNVQTNGNTTTFSAAFPYEQYLMNGLTIAALASGSSFASAGAVAAASTYGPGLIEIN